MLKIHFKWLWDNIKNETNLSSFILLEALHSNLTVYLHTCLRRGNIQGEVTMTIKISVRIQILIWRPKYRQPVYVGIYLPLAPTHSNYRLETKKHNLKSFCNELKPTRPFLWGHTQQLQIILLCLRVHVYTQTCDENALIWGLPRRMFRPPTTWNFDNVNNQYSYSLVKRTKRNSRCVADSKVA